MISQIIDIQRKIRASLSIFYNKNELNNEREKKLSEEAKILGENILKSKKSNYKKTHKIFSNKTLNIIFSQNVQSFPILDSNVLDVVHKGQFIIC